MNLPLSISSKLTWLLSSIYFIRKHFWGIMGLGFIAGFGRVIQLGGFGEITPFTHIILEVIIELARVLLFLYVLGYANVKNGINRIKCLFTQRTNRKLKGRLAWHNLKKNWVALIYNFAGFLLIAFAFNYVIDLLAYETCLYLALTSRNILVDTASEWTILLFFKNLSVIPFTLVFDAIFFLWITDNIHLNKHSFEPSL